MKRELALQLLQTIIPGLTDESSAARLFRDLQLLADYKYNKYEMYHPGRLFLENLYLWLQQFAENERAEALAFIQKQLIFVSREEFQQLAQVLYNDRIRRRQFEIAAERASLPRHRVRAVRDSAAFARTLRASLYVGMSDGARLDFIRRHNLQLNNEQVLPYYAVHKEKVDECLQALRAEVGDPSALFRCLFLVDDFAGSGNTLLREVVTVALPDTWEPPAVPARWQARLRFKDQPPAMEFLYRGEIVEADLNDLRSLDGNEAYLGALTALAEKCRTRDTTVKGSLHKAAIGAIGAALEPDSAIFFCPLLTTEHALGHLTPLLARLPGQFSRTDILPGAVIDPHVPITDATSPIGALCEKYYDESLGDEHTGNIKFGYDGCGLPLVLHHNTPNNSLYLLWSRRSDKVVPLFERYERHGREGL
jgi:hypothetical protein